MTTAPVINSLKDIVQEKHRMGSVVRMSYSQATIVTNDFAQAKVGGVPQHGLLLAPMPNPTGGDPAEVLLLSVRQPVDLGIHRELSAVREELAAKGQAAEDERVKARLQDMGFECDILGTFYVSERGEVLFGADVETVYGNAIFPVYKPRGRALSLIASYGQGVHKAAQAGRLLDIGYVRFSETQSDFDPDARMFINVDDIVGSKTALLAKTRAGKSNTVKILVQSVFEYGKAKGDPIPQVIFDPQGEYANANAQDDASAIANLGDASQISIYKIMEHAMDPKEKHLQFNLFNGTNLTLTWEMLLAELDAGVSAGSNYISDLYNIRFADALPTEKSARIHHQRRRMGLYALMHLSGADGALDNLYITVDKDLAAAIRETFSTQDVAMSANGKELRVLTAEGAYKLMLHLYANKEQLTDSWQRDFANGDLRIFMDQIVAIKEQGRNGVKAAIQRIKPLHNPQANGDVRENVWNDIEAGKIIVIDLSRGSAKTSQTLSEVIVNHILAKASARFVTNLTPKPLQLVVEEAHNLFDRNSKSENTRDPWVRISKEAAKYQIGLIYATQEVSSVDTKILSNTSNWVIAHLNSRIETRELARYYSFGDWEDHILRSSTPGFVRLKTASSPYIIPVQIDRFTPGAMMLATAESFEAKPTAEEAADELDEDLESLLDGESLEEAAPF